MATMETKAAGGIGDAVLRKEDRKFVTGEGRYVDDLRLPGMLHAVFVRSPFGHARINGIDTAAAEALPGVHRVLTHANLPAETGVLSASNPPGSDVRQPVQHLLAKDEVRYVGEPVAIVIADDRYIARDGADLVLVDYDPLPVVCDAEAALADGAPLVHSEYPDNAAATISHETDGFAEAMAGAARTVELRVVNQRVTPMPMETRGCIGDWQQATGEVTLYTSTQVAHFVRTFVSIVCGTSEAKVRVVTPDVGGGFGAKLNTYREEFAVCSASRAVGVPVKWIEDRSENAVATIHGRDQVQYYTAGVDDSGKIVALKFDAIQNNGAYHQLLTPSISHLTVFMVPGCYDIQNISIRMRQAFTNTTPTDAYRGAGRPEATHGIERLMDAIADDLGIDAAEVRRANFIKPDQFPYSSSTGLVYDSGAYDATLDEALRLADYAGFAARRAESEANGRYRGIGLSTYVEVCGLAPSAVTAAIGIGAPGGEHSTVRLHPTGKATVITGTSPHGQGHATSWSQIVQTELGIPFDDVEVIHGDTAFQPYGLGTYGSRSLAVGGVALYRSLGKVREKAREIAANLLECSVDDLEWTGSSWQVKGSPDRAKTIQELAGAAWAANSMPEGVEPVLEATTFHDPPNFTFPFGTHVCEVEIDPATGRIEIVNYTAVDDCGNVINPLIVDGQVHGGIIQGLGQALYEETVYGEDGQMLTPTLVEYLVPSAADVPEMTLARTTTPSPSNPMGVKGIGEAGTIAASSAIVNAAVDALSGLGIRHLEMPMQPARVWSAIQEAQS
jgi:carbon-monoxide dehydrogenase large subunit